MKDYNSPYRVWAALPELYRECFTPPPTKGVSEYSHEIRTDKMDQFYALLALAGGEVAYTYVYRYGEAPYHYRRFGGTFLRGNTVNLRLLLKFLEEGP